jgi:hypothetical protein
MARLILSVKTRPRLSKRERTALRKNLEEEAGRLGRSLPEHLGIIAAEYREKNLAKSSGAAVRKFPRHPKITQQLVRLLASEAGLTPNEYIRQQIKGEKVEPLQGLQNWYGQIYGEFAKGPLSEVLREALLCASGQSEQLMPLVRTAIERGNVKFLEQITRCVALIHGIKHEANGQATRVASPNKMKIMLAYLRLTGLDGQLPSAAEVRVLLAAQSCGSGKVKPRFSDIWYLLRSGPADDSDAEPNPTSRYEISSTSYIKKILRSVSWPVRTLHGPLTVKQVKRLLARARVHYQDDPVS